MRTPGITLSVIALANTASAFFPFYPDYVCANKNRLDCVATVHTIEGGVAGREAGSNFKIGQRVPKNNKAIEDQVIDTTRRLRRKYQSSRASNEDDSNNEKRTNTYSVVTAATPSQTDSAGIYQDGADCSYFVQVRLGSANQPMYMLLDTGADSSWVMGLACTSSACSTHNTFDPSSSSTFKNLGASFAVEYGSGSVSGIVGTDSLSLAGLDLSVTLSIANITSNQFNDFPMDGILGLSLGKSDQPSFIESLVSAKALKSNLFGISLNRASDGTNTGEINFGAPDTSRYSGSPTYVSVSSIGNGFWSLPLDNVGAGSSQSGITTKLAYIDTGTSFIFASPADAKTFHALVPGATSSDGGMTYHVPCSTTMSMSFTFGGTTFTVSPKDWISAPSNGVCTSNIYGHDVVGGNWLLGDTYLKNVYTIFDIDQTRVGFAQNVQDSASSVTATSSSSVTGSSTAFTSVTSTASTLTSSVSATGSSTPGSGPGLNGQESMSVSGTAAAETTSPTSTASAAKNSGASLNCFSSSAISITVALLVTVYGASIM